MWYRYLGAISQIKQALGENIQHFSPYCGNFSILAANGKTMNIAGSGSLELIIMGLKFC